MASGQWRDGNQHGRGKFALPSGNRYEGDFAHSGPSGLGRFTWASNGHVYEGEFTNDGLNGLGIKWDRDGRLLMCGRWAGERLVESRPVPWSKLLSSARLSAAGQRHNCTDHRAALSHVGSCHSL